MTKAAYYTIVTAGLIIASQHNFKVMEFILCVLLAGGFAWEVYKNAKKTSNQND